jgi:hypothetical protein
MGTVDLNGDTIVTDERPSPSKTVEVKDRMAQRLVAECGVSEWQAKALVDSIGPEWSTLVREAELLIKLK